jgi:glycosyltransferase involved in cell wall biosynthesis
MNDTHQPGLLFLEALPTIAGGQTVLLNLMPALRDHYRLAVLLPGDGPLAAALRAEGVTCFFAPVGRYSLMRKSLHDVAAYAARTPLLAWRTAQLIRQWRAELVYANSGPTFLWGALAAQLTGRPMIWHHHNLLADGKTLRLVQAAARLPAVRRILCVSAAAQAQFPRVAAKTVVIRNGVDTEKFRPDPAARAQIRQELGIPLNAAVVGMVGDLIPLKGQATLLAALPALAAAASRSVGDPGGRCARRRRRERTLRRAAADAGHGPGQAGGPPRRFTCAAERLRPAGGGFGARDRPPRAAGGAGDGRPGRQHARGLCTGPAACGRALWCGECRGIG